MVVELGLAVAGLGDAGFLIGQFTGVILDNLLLAADGGEAGDVLAVAFFVPGQVLNVGIEAAAFGVETGDLCFDV